MWGGGIFVHVVCFFLCFLCLFFSCCLLLTLKSPADHCAHLGGSSSGIVENFNPEKDAVVVFWRGFFEAKGKLGEKPGGKA